MFYFSVKRQTDLVFLASNALLYSSSNACFTRKSPKSSDSQNSKSPISLVPSPGSSIFSLNSNGNSGSPIVLTGIRRVLSSIRGTTGCRATFIFFVFGSSFRPYSSPFEIVISSNSSCTSLPFLHSFDS